MIPARLWITTADAARVLGLSPRRVRQLKYRLGGYMVAGRLVFPPSVVERYRTKRGTV